MINVYFNKQCRNSDFSMADLHSHAYYEIYYLAKGERLLLFDDRLHTLSAPAIIVIPPWVMHKTEGGPYLRYNIYVSPQYLNGFEEKTLQSLSLKSLPLSKTEHTILLDLFEEAVNMHSQPDYKSIQHALFSYFIVRLSKMKIESKAETELNNQKSSQKTSPVTLKVLSYIHEHYRENITLEDLSQQFHIAKSTLNYDFKAAISCTPIKYMRNYRLTKSKELLIQSSKSIHEIADECGFSSPNYFGLIFKMDEGISPAAYRKLNR